MASDTVMVNYIGGPLEGHWQCVDAEEFDVWAGQFPHIELNHDGELCFYQAYKMYTVCDLEVNVYWSLSIRDPHGKLSLSHDGDDDGYDGWLPVGDRYEDSE